VIDGKNEDHIRRCEDYAPKRLARADVAAFREMYAQAMEAHRHSRHKGYRGSLFVALSRDRRKRGIALLGRTFPGCRVTAEWTQERKNGEWGLNVVVRGISVRRDGVPISPGQTHREGNAYVGALPIGRHRFRKASTQTQFCREVSHMVRLGLGWSRKWSS
jgi:hypothetical protein